MGDTLAGLHAVIGVLLALIAQGRGQQKQGQVIDVAIFESVFNLLEAVVPEYDGAGVVRGPSGSTVTGIVPTNTYLCRDQKYVVIGANGDSLFQRLMRAIGRPELATDPRFATNPKRVGHEREIDAIITAWTQANDAPFVLSTLEQAGVPAGPIYSVADMVADPHYQARELFESVPTPQGPLRIPAILPKLEHTPGATRWPGPKIGEHTEQVLKELLHLDEERIRTLRSEKVI